MSKHILQLSKDHSFFIPGLQEITERVYELLHGDELRVEEQETCVDIVKSISTNLIVALSSHGKHYSLFSII